MFEAFGQFTPILFLFKTKALFARCSSRTIVFSGLLARVVAKPFKVRLAEFKGLRARLTCTKLCQKERLYEQ